VRLGDAYERLKYEIVKFVFRRTTTVVSAVIKQTAN